MNSFQRVLRLLILITGIFQVLLGVIFWTGHARQLVPLHMAVGLLFVLALLMHSFRAFMAGVSRGFASFLALWAVGVLAFGMTQAAILPGPLHWVVRVLHLLVGGLAMGFARTLGTRLVGAAAARAGADTSRVQAVAAN